MQVSLLFDDDTTLLSEGRTPQQSVEAAENDFRQAKEWFAANILLLNEADSKSSLHPYDKVLRTTIGYRKWNLLHIGLGITIGS